MLMFRRYLGIAAALLVLGGLTACPAAPPDPPDPPPPQNEIEALEVAAFHAVNEERVAEGVPALVMAEDVRLMARAHSEDMVVRGFFSHTNPDGEGLAERLAAHHVSYTLAGENLAYNNSPLPVEMAVVGWLQSPGHRENMLDPRFVYTGVGVAVDGDMVYFTQVFVRR